MAHRITLLVAAALLLLALPATAEAKTLSTSSEHQLTATVVGGDGDSSTGGPWSGWSLAAWQRESIARPVGRRPVRTNEASGYFVFSSFVPAGRGRRHSVYTVVWAWLPTNFAAVINLDEARTTFTAADATVSTWYDFDFAADPTPDADRTTTVTLTVRGTWRGAGRIETQHETTRTEGDGTVETVRSVLRSRDARARLLVSDSTRKTWMDGSYEAALYADQRYGTITTAR